jgi:hypothetical protein
MKPWKPSGLTRIVGLALALSVFAACDDETTGPGDTDPVATAQAIEDVTAQFFTDNEAVQTVNGLSPLIAALIGGMPPLSLIQSDGPALDKLADGVLGPALVPEEIPAALLNTQWRLNETTLEYELDTNPDPDRPANGVRFLLYAVNPISGQPIVPLQEIGHLDLIDTSTLPTITIQMIAVIQDVTLIDLTVSATTAETSLTVTGDGFISDGTDQLVIDLDIDGSVTGETAITLDASLVLSVADITITATVTGDVDVAQETGTISIALSIVSDDGSISFSLDLDSQGVISGDVRFGGQVVALISGNADTEEIVITNAQGGDLTPAEIAALEEMFNIFFEVLEGAAGILALMLLLFGFAF